MDAEVDNNVIDNEIDSARDGGRIENEIDLASDGGRIEKDMDSFGTLSDEDLLNNEEEFLYVFDIQYLIFCEIVLDNILYISFYIYMLNSVCGRYFLKH